MGASDTVYLTLAQGGRPVVEYALNGTPSPAGTGSLSRAEEDENVLLLTMTQADTLALAVGDAELARKLEDKRKRDAAAALEKDAGIMARL